MRMKRPDDYWVNKLKLWVILHGGMKKYEQANGRANCHHHVPGVKWNCTKRNNKRKRLMISMDLCYFELSHRMYTTSWFYIECIKHV